MGFFGRRPARSRFESRRLSTAFFQSHIVVPQVFVFIALLLAGSLVQEDFRTVLFKLLSIVYLLSVSVLISLLARSVSMRTVVMHLLGFSLFLIFAAAALAQNGTVAVVIPLALLVLCYTVVPLNLAEAVLLAAGIGCEAAVLTLLRMLMMPRGIAATFFHESAAAAVPWNFSYALLLLCLAIGAVVVSAVVRGGTGVVLAPDRSDLAMLPPPSFDLAKGAKSEVDPAPLKACQAFLLTALRYDFVAPLATLHLLVGGWLTWGMLHAERGVRELGVACAALAIFQLILLPTLIAARTREELTSGAFVMSLSAFGWSVIALFLPPGLAAAPVMIWLMCVAMNLVLPWRTELRVAMNGASLLFLTLMVIGSDFTSPPIAILLGAVLVASTVGGWILQLRVTSLFAMMLLRRWGSRPYSVSIYMQVCAWMIGTVAETPRVLILRPGDDEVVSDDAIEPSAIESGFARNLALRLKESGQDEGIFSWRSLGAQYHDAALGWFGFVPSRIFFAMFRPRAGENSGEIVIVAPLRPGARLNGLRRLFVKLKELIWIPRLYLAKLESSGNTSDALLSIQEALFEREQDLALAIHTVNNTTQEILTHANAGTRTAEEGTAPSRGGVLSDIIVKIQVLAQRLSDIRLVRELRALNKSAGTRLLPAGHLVDEFSVYARERCRGRGALLGFNGAVSPDLRIECASADLAGTALRVAMESLLEKSAHGAELAIEIGASESFLLIRFRGSFPGVDDFAQFAATDLPLQAVSHFIALSGGSFSAGDAGEEHELTFSFPAAIVKEPEPQFGRREWALVVDDNPQFTRFYSMAVEALAVESVVAHSKKEAESILAARGRPRIVVSDIRLGDGSGLDLLAFLRERFGERLPILLVSGEVSAAPSTANGYSAHTHFLTKPVTRRKLFEEIRQMLGRGADEKA